MNCCVAFFDIKGSATHSIDALVMAKMKELKLIDSFINILKLELFGVSLGVYS